MKECNVTAIVTKAEDWKENDRLVRLFTVEGGMIRARVRGVKKPNAKLKFAAQPFAFCRYSLVEKGGYYSVTGASEAESLFAVTADVEKYAVGCLMLEVADCVVDEIPNPDLFVKLLKALKSLIYDKTKPCLIGAKFTVAALHGIGYGNTYEGGGAVEKLLRRIRGCPLAELDKIECDRSEAAAALRHAARECEYHFDRRLMSLSGI